MSADQTAPGRRDAAPVVVDKLTTVVRNKAGDPIFIGWGPDGGAAATKDRRAVSPAGQDLLRVYERARNLLVPVVPYVELVPVEYGYIKLKDLAAPAEDYFIVNVKDAEGQTTPYRIGEMELLDGIVNAQSFFQDTSTTGSLGQAIVPSDAIYAVVAPCFELDPRRTALAILFRPLVDGAPQEASFQPFVVSVLRYLWQNDRKDDPAGRKGYYDIVLADPRARPPRPPLLLRLMFTNEDTARRRWETLRRLLFKLPEPSARSDDADNFGDLDMPRLFALATAMRDAARRYFDRRDTIKRSFRFDRS